jgi:hypothetical protein
MFINLRHYTPMTPHSYIFAGFERPHLDPPNDRPEVG